MEAKMASAMRTVVRALAKALTCNAITIKPPEFLRSLPWSALIHSAMRSTVACSTPK
jgi:hypothetical protein